MMHLDSRPDAYLRELWAALAELSRQVSDMTLSRACQALRLTRKKTLIAIEQDRPDVIEARRRYMAGQAVYLKTKGRLEREAAHRLSAPMETSIPELAKSDGVPCCGRRKASEFT